MGTVNILLAASLLRSYISGTGGMTGSAQMVRSTDELASEKGTDLKILVLLELKTFEALS